MMDPTNENADADRPSVAAVDGDNALKKTWLNLLPVEQVIEIVLKLDEHAPLSIRNEIWPKDLKAAVFNAAVATIIESSGKGKTVDLSSINIQDVSKSADPPDLSNAQRSASPSTDVEDTSSAPSPATKQKETQHMPVSERVVPAIHPGATAVLTSSATIPASYPTSSTTPYSSSSYPYSYSYPGFHYAHTNQQPYMYSYPVAPASGPTPYSPMPPPAGAKASSSGSKEGEDLPSYEEMLVQALAELNDPSGIAPKQLFQWMAMRYPLQANFRPSASQALQKAYKRGRFEKNKDGKYRLNAAWEGGNTSKRTTRRPQSYAKAVSNPNPSSHLPTNTHAYPPYQWYSASQSLQQLKSQNHTPPTQQGLSTAAPTAAPENVCEDDAESHRDAWEAAQSILQALNFGALLKHSKPDSEHTDLATESDQPLTDAEGNIDGSVASVAPVSSIPKPASAFPPPIFAGDIPFAPFSATLTSTVVNKGRSIHEPPPMAALLPPLPVSLSANDLVEGTGADANGRTQSDTAATSSAAEGVHVSQSDRVVLQGNLALLAAQLADLASTDEDNDGADSDTVIGMGGAHWPSLAEAASTSASASASASSALTLLNGLGTDMFGTNGWAGLQGVGVDA